jgi:hypothetical protein
MSTLAPPAFFIRNIAMCFDNTLGVANERRHSKTI